MHVGMYDCMSSESESELVNQLSVILIKSSKQITNVYIHIHRSMYVCMYVCMRSESESALQSSPPQLKGVRVISARVCTRVRVRVCVCWYYFAGKYIQTHTHKYTRTLTEARKAQQKRPMAGLTTGCCTKKEICIEEEQRLKQSAVRCTKKTKKEKI
jgi:hypothetical protein